jgi:transcription-repair coupling factor (superfamily II helicase)
MDENRLSGYRIMTEKEHKPNSGWELGPGLTKTVALLDEKARAQVVGLEGAARAFALARLWKHDPHTCLVACPTLAVAESLCRDLEFFLAGEQEGTSPVRLYPSYEVSPYQGVDPPPEVTARRLAVLWELLLDEQPLLIVTSAKGLSPRLPPPEYLVDSSLYINRGQSLERDDLVEILINGGYTPVSLVEQEGDFAVRGSVVDFFGPLLDDPVRVEFFGDEVESLRRFDPADQRSQMGLDQAVVMPCHPVDLSVKAGERAVKRLRELADAEGLSARRLGELVERIQLRAPFAGLESLLPLYYDNAADLFAYLPQDCRHVMIEPAELEQRLLAEAESLEDEFHDAREEGRIVLAPPVMRRTPGQVKQRLDSRPRLGFRALPVEGEDKDSVVRLSAASHTGLHGELSRGGEGSLVERFLAWQAGQGRQVVLVCRSRTQLDRLSEIFTEREQAVRHVSRMAQVQGGPGEGLTLLIGGLTSGFTPDSPGITLVTEDEVFGAPRIVRKKPAASMSAMLAALDDLSPGDLVVHVDHGIGRYQGLESLAVGPSEGDFLLITYKDGDKLYLPADRIGLVSKYRGPDDNNPALERLGGKAWTRTKSRVKKAVEAIAKDLVDLYAARSFQKGHAFGEPDAHYREFEASFPFAETPDQAQAIDDVLSDLSAPKPMDRLVCGDVGFGKTEVALRAAYLAAMQGKQVAFLVPTTVLAEQHYQTCLDRFKDLPLEVAALSRFKTPAQQKKILAGLAQGKIDLVVGTHRLLSKDVVFKDLGLLIVDEEHRFGVKDKEKLKKMRRMVDVLALTATPIPRTMQMSLSGIRDLSIISTPPAERQSIKTYLAAFSPKAMQDAIERELSRGGQVFFVHNRVKDITRLARMVTTLVPRAKVGIAHGQLSEKTLERVMMRFVNQELDVLVCTTIVESGLDIPSANTIIIHDADKLGLSQIYQLRGRVGRSGEKAYAYLFIKSETSLSREAQKRLKALMDFTHLGAGFAIAMHDMQIRGAGNMLGEAQSGRAAEVGYELYVQMLEEAVARLKGEAPSEGAEPELKLAFRVGLPDTFVPDAQVRLNLYRRLGRLRHGEELAALKTELEDRFGPVPQAADNLLKAVELKNLLRRLWAHRLDLSQGAMKVHFSSSPQVDLKRLMDMAGDPKSGVQVFPDGQVSVRLNSQKPPFEQANSFLRAITP